MKPESKMWQKLRPYLLAAKLDPVRVENPIHPGTPDVNCIAAWVELKTLATWPVRPGSLVTPCKFTPQQKVFLYRRWRAGGRCYLLLEVAGEWLLFDGDVAAKVVGRTTRAGLYSNARLTTREPALIAEALR